MKKKIIYILSITATILFTSCDGFLNQMPDNRTELNNAEKVAQLLVSAYPTGTYVQMTELMSDNVTDNGPLYTFFNKTVEESYKWENFTDNQQDTPQFVWELYYKSIAAANHALQFIESVDNPDDYSPHKGEALICRAYAHFILVNIFSQHYNKQTSTTDLGIPYVEESEKIVEGKYERGTVADVYERINRDIEEALPLISDSYYKKSAIKYHFNQKAAYAFAARFNLYYENYDKCITYATKAIGNDPEKVLRDYESYLSFSSNKDVAIEYIQSNPPCNLLLMPAASQWTYNHWGYRTWYRYAHNMKKLEETLWGPGPWVDSEYFYPAAKVFGTDRVTYFPKYNLLIEYSDPVAGTGFLNIVNTVFTTDEALLCRAEAYVHKKDYVNATKDLAAWYNKRTVSGVPELTETKIEDYYSTAVSVLTPELNPKFEIADEKQLNFLHCVLHFRRCETIHEGLRWFDIRRYGIEVKHAIYGQDDDVLKKDDLRRVIQIPSAVIAAGMEANPR
ncbi:RagB/SusD family nutrient uptake outer membrane protein [Paludibacter sp. 221]|uniref:RagB/SusD family nutrient uptake outer membrane protein n=1 Tax=Paludibacter sp. 221 TaxID=2302939 RepID=UPI0013D79970|nr:RagB/SusD family nutrient uptake outer membrane protein [Paludibacter sp. 221]NDV45594.1 RagB/SusD family nutrient uptake outer membrane protein [Paludibacter sp. 221]